MMLIKNMNDVPSVPTNQEMERAYGDNLDQMFTDHNTLISRILNEEELLIEAHKVHVNEIINCEKYEM